MQSESDPRTAATGREARRVELAAAYGVNPSDVSDEALDRASSAAQVCESDEIVHRGIAAHCEIVDDPDNDSHVIVRLWYSPRRDGDTVPAFEAYVRVGPKS